MSSAAIMEHKAERGPWALARMAGAFQLLAYLTATFGQVIVVDRLVVSGNAAATAVNILTHQRLFWLGFASAIIGVVFHLAWALVLYDLFKPVNRRVSMFALLVMLVACGIHVVASILYVAPNVLLNPGGSLNGLTGSQLQALAYVFVRMNGYAFNAFLILFGLWLLLTGFLIFRSIFLPRVLGVLVAIAGFGWMMYLVPPLATHLFIPYIAGASGLGEIPLLLWFLVVGVNDQRWKEQASAAAQHAL